MMGFVLFAKTNSGKVTVVFRPPHGDVPRVLLCTDIMSFFKKKTEHFFSFFSKKCKKKIFVSSPWNFEKKPSRILLLQTHFRSLRKFKRNSCRSQIVEYSNEFLLKGL